MVALHYLFRIVPGALGTGAALGAVLALAGCGIFAVGLSRISSRRRRIAYLITPLLMVLTFVVAFAPNFRRASLQRQLRALGATVTSDTDVGDGVWFRYHNMYLPCWMKDQLGDAFFGRIDEVNFSYAEVPVDDVAKLEFGEPIATLNLSFTDISNDELVRLTQIIDARQVLLNSLPVDAETLNAFGQMRSLTRLTAIETRVSKADARKFAIGHPKINLVHGDRSNGYGFVRAPLAGP